jgi:hypothetical protein
MTSRSIGRNAAHSLPIELGETPMILALGKGHYPALVLAFGLVLGGFTSQAGEVTFYHGRNIGFQGLYNPSLEIFVDGKHIGRLARDERITVQLSDGKHLFRLGAEPNSVQMFTVTGEHIFRFSNVTGNHLWLFFSEVYLTDPVIKAEFEKTKEVQTGTVNPKEAAK